MNLTKRKEKYEDRGTKDDAIAFPYDPSSPQDHKVAQKDLSRCRIVLSIRSAP